MPPKSRKTDQKKPAILPRNPQAKAAHYSLSMDSDSFFGTDREQQLFKSLTYRLFAAVLAKKLRDSGKDSIAGIINPYDGDHHIKKLKDLAPEFLPLVPKILDYLRNGRHEGRKGAARKKGNTTILVKDLQDWFGALQEKYKNKPEKEWPEIITNAIEQDEFVEEIRKQVGIGNKADEKQPKVAAAEISFETLTSSFSSSPKDSEPTELSTSELPEAEFSIPSSLPKSTQDLSAEETFIKYLVADISGESDLSLELLKQAANKGHLEAKYLLSGKYFSGNGVNNDLELAHTLLVEAAKIDDLEHGNAMAQNCLGISLFRDSDSTIYQTGLKYIKSAAEHHNLPIAKTCLAAIYYKQGQQSKANKLMELAAKDGDSNAQWMIAQFHLQGAN